MGNGRSQLLAVFGVVMTIVFLIELSDQQTRAAAGYTFELGGLAVMGMLMVAFFVGSYTTRSRPVSQLPPPVPPGSNPARWAPDPSGDHRLRWWDGQRWTDHTHD